MKWLLSSLVGSDVIFGGALARGWVGFGVLLTSVAILIEAQREEQRKVGSFSRAKSKGNWLVGMRVGLK